jgi:hypothetical protein
MIDGSHSPYHAQEHRLSAWWSAGTPESATPQGVTADAPQHASQEEEPFVIELVVPEIPTAQGSPAEEQQQPEDHDIEDKADEKYPPLSDTGDEKMY